MRQDDADVRKSYCRNCMATCGLEFDVQDNKILEVRGDKDHKTSLGYLCIKGRTSVDHHNGDDRLATTKQRIADGAYEPVHVSVAYDQIAEKLLQLLETYGPRSIGLYYGTGSTNSSINMAVVKSWINSTIGSPNLFSSITIDQSAKWVTAGRLGYFATGKYVGEDCEVAMLVGTNPVVSHMGIPTCPFPAKRNPSKHIRAYKKAGTTKLIVIDPRTTETARNADLHLQIKPGEDPIVIAAIIREIFCNGWENREFLDRFATSVASLKKMVDSVSVEEAAERAGVDADAIRNAAKMFATAGRASAFSGTGPDMASYSNLAEHLIETLNVVCGGYRKAGDKIANTGLIFGAAATTECVLPPHRSWESSTQCLSAPAGRLNGEFPTALLPGEINAASEDRIRALIVVGGNPIAALGSPDSTLQAFDALELLVTLDIRQTETTRVSDFAIATKAPYERHDFTGLGDLHAAAPFAQYTKPVVNPSADLVDDWEFFWEISRRMGLRIALKRPAVGFPDDAQPVGIDLDMEQKPTTRELIALLCDSGGRVSLQELEKHQSGYLDDSAVPVTIHSADRDDGCRLNVCPDDLNAEFESYLGATRQTKYQYSLVCSRRIETMNSAFANADRNRKRFPGQLVHMHPDDMANENVSGGDEVRVESDCGALTATVRADKSLKRGVIAMNHMAIPTNSDKNSARAVNALVSLSQNLDTINFMPRQSGIPVNVT